MIKETEKISALTSKLAAAGTRTTNLEHQLKQQEISNSIYGQVNQNQNVPIQQRPQFQAVPQPHSLPPSPPTQYVGAPPPPAYVSQQYGQFGQHGQVNKNQNVPIKKIPQFTAVLQPHSLLPSPTTKYVGVPPLPAYVSQ